LKKVHGCLEESLQSGGHACSTFISATETKLYTQRLFTSQCCRRTGPPPLPPPPKVTSSPNTLDKHQNARTYYCQLQNNKQRWPSAATSWTLWPVQPLLHTPCLSAAPHLQLPSVPPCHALRLLRRCRAQQPRAWDFGRAVEVRRGSQPVTCTTAGETAANARPSSSDHPLLRAHAAPSKGALHLDTGGLQHSCARDSTPADVKRLAQLDASS
jgi:hypothetical protein